MKKQVTELKAEQQAQKSARESLAKQLEGYTADESVDARHVAKAIDEWRDAGLSQTELQQRLNDWDPNMEHHDVKGTEDTEGAEMKIVHIKIKKKVRVRHC